MINPLPSLSNVPLHYATFEDLLSECTGRIQEYAAELALTLPLRLRASYPRPSQAQVRTSLSYPLVNLQRGSEEESIGLSFQSLDTITAIDRQAAKLSFPKNCCLTRYIVADTRLKEV
jgi:hypothetical protein